MHAELCLSLLETEKKRNELRRDEAATIQPDLPPLPPEMEEFLKPLTDEELEITKLRHGLADGCHHTFEEVGRRLKMTPDDVQEIAMRAETKLVSQNTPNKNLEYTVTGGVSSRGHPGAGRCRYLERVIQRWNEARRLNRGLGSREYLTCGEFSTRSGRPRRSSPLPRCCASDSASCRLTSLGALAVIIAGSATGAAAQRLRGGGGVLGGRWWGDGLYGAARSTLLVAVPKPADEDLDRRSGQRVPVRGCVWRLIGSVVGLLVRMCRVPFHRALAVTGDL